MIPKRVTLENFLSFGPKQDVAFDDGDRGVDQRAFDVSRRRASDAAGRGFGGGHVRHPIT